MERSLKLVNFWPSVEDRTGEQEIRSDDVRWNDPRARELLAFCGRRDKEALSSTDRPPSRYELGDPLL